MLEGSSAGHVFYASSPQTEEDNTKDHKKMVDHENISTSTEGDGSMRWMSSKMRVKRKILPSSNNHSDQINFSDHGNSSTDVVVRVCSDCNTTKTPLWRGGPQGPKVIYLCTSFIFYELKHTLSGYVHFDGME